MSYCSDDERQPLRSSAYELPPPIQTAASFDDSSLVKRLRLENDSLMEELLSLREELNKYKAINNNPSSLSTTPPPSRLSSWKFQTPPTTKPRTTGTPLSNPPLIRKANRHPSDRFPVTSSDDDDDDDSLDVSLQQKTGIHESFAGLKHRRHSPPKSKSPTVHKRAMTHPDTILFLDSLDDEQVHVVKKTVSTPETVASTNDVPFGVEDDDDQNALTQFSFLAAVQDRAGWLVFLLFFQSLSSFIIGRNEKLLQNHLVIVRFLTMLVGAGGNAGNQASVGVIRGLAIGTVHDQNIRQTVFREIKVGLALSLVLGVSGAIRAALFMTPWAETLAITTSLVSIVFLSVFLGAILPLVMRFCRVDPAHSSTTIQVIMDILGVMITVHVSSFILDVWLTPITTGDDD